MGSLWSAMMSVASLAQGAGIAAGWVRDHSGICITIGFLVAIVGGFLMFVEITSRRERRNRHPIRCPKCGGTEHHWAISGFWDGDNCGGVFSYGTCKHCGSRIGRWDKKPPYAPSEEEWQLEVESLKDFVKNAPDPKKAS